jgi:hypothetical protein
VRRLRILLLIFFLAVFAVFAVSNVREYLTSDAEAPVITAPSDTIEASVSVTDEELLKGMMANDNLDGNVTDSLVVVSKSKFIASNTRHITYAAFDENNNVGTYTRRLVYTDYHSPRFSMSQPFRFVAGNSSYDYLRHIRASDCLDGNITSQIKITFGNTEMASGSTSVQNVHLQVTNSAGDTSSLELIATFEDFDSYSKASPALSEYIIYVPVGQRPDPDLREYLTGIWTAGNVRKFEDFGFTPDDVSISDREVNYRVPGVYQATFRLTRGTPNASGGTYRTEFGTTTMIIVVEGKK